MSVLSYISQIETSPDWAVNSTRASFKTASKGPYKWCSDEELWQLEEGFGLHGSFWRLDLWPKRYNSG